MGLDDEAIARRWLSKRIKEGLAKRRAAGKAIGRRPAADAVCARIVQLDAEGLGPSAIARRLGEEGFATPQKAAQWRPSSVAAILKRAKR